MIAYLKAETLSRDKEAELIAAAQAGDVEARNRLVMAHLPFVKWWARRQRRLPWMTFGDVVSVAVLGFIRAVEKFDERKQCRLTSYAKQWMRAKLGDEVNNNSLIHIPRNVLQAARIPGKLPERLARAVLFVSGGLRTFPPATFERMNRRWWAERWPEEVDYEHD